MMSHGLIVVPRSLPMFQRERRFNKPASAGENNAIYQLIKSFRKPPGGPTSSQRYPSSRRGRGPGKLRVAGVCAQTREGQNESKALRWFWMLLETLLVPTNSYLAFMSAPKHTG
jgi:hypothetical protein